MPVETADTVSGWKARDGSEMQPGLGDIEASCGQDTPPTGASNPTGVWRGDMMRRDALASDHSQHLRNLKKRLIPGGMGDLARAVKRREQSYVLQDLVGAAK